MKRLISNYSHAAAFNAQDLLNIEGSLRNSDALLNTDYGDLLGSLKCLHNAKEDLELAIKVITERLYYLDAEEIRAIDCTIVGAK